MLPNSDLAKAVSYAMNQWQAIRRYTEDGRLSIDNNVSERTLRHQAIGRKNWLFLGSQQAGPRAERRPVAQGVCCRLSDWALWQDTFALSLQPFAEGFEQRH
jgi:hypothetical protein